jgi:hypothetical protein
VFDGHFQSTLFSYKNVVVVVLLLSDHVDEYIHSLYFSAVAIMADYRKILCILTVLVAIYICFEQLNIFYMLSPATNGGDRGTARTSSARTVNIPTSSKKYLLNQSTIIKDYNLSSLLRILNSQSDFFESWDHESNDALFSLKYSLFASSLLPWLVGTPPTPLLVPKNPMHMKLDCSDPRYGLVLSGKKLSTPRMIVDFIPFGYDIDKLEIRLLENFNNVDAFVIYESMMTQTGLIVCVFRYLADICGTLKGRKSRSYFK